MTKKFFIVIPFSVWDMDAKKDKGPLDFLQILSPKKAPTLTEDVFQRCKAQLWQRMEFVALGLRRCGLQSIPLRTSEIIEFLWALHHPLQAERGYYPEIPPELMV